MVLLSEASACLIWKRDGVRLGGGDVEVGLGRFELFLGDEVVVEELLHALQGVLVALQPGLGLDQVGLGGPDEVLVAVGVGLVLGRVQLEQEVAGLDLLALLDADLDDPAGDLGADVDVLLRLDLARGRDDGGQVLLLDLVDGHLDRLLTAGLEVGDDDGADAQHHGQDDQELFPPFEETHLFTHGYSLSGRVQIGAVYYTTEMARPGSAGRTGSNLYVSSF